MSKQWRPLSCRLMHKWRRPQTTHGYKCERCGALRSKPK